jgi:peptidyl-prolyl cis-trans isomerase A (cyclophilin A)
MLRPILALLALATTSAIAQQPGPTPVPAPVAAEGPRVTIATTDGAIVVALDRTHAPLSTANFLRYVDAKRFDGITFYRSMKLPWNAGVIQAGQRDPKKLYPPIAHEPTTATGLSHVEGTISLARREPGTGQAEWSITIGDMTGLDAKPGAPGDNAGYAAFGRVVEGMDVVKRIWSGPTDPTAGEGAMKGQILKPPVRILAVRRVP